MKRIKRLPPNKNWLLTLLFNLEPEHEVFTKGYKKPKQSRMNMYEEIEVDDYDNFFEGLELAKKTKRTTIPGVTKHMKKVQKSKAMQNALDYYQKKLQELNAEKSEDSSDESDSDEQGSQVSDPG